MKWLGAALSSAGLCKGKHNLQQGGREVAHVMNCGRVHMKFGALHEAGFVQTEGTDTIRR